MRKKLRSLMVVPFLATGMGLIGCGDDDPAAPTNAAPIACFTMSAVLEEDAHCAYQLDFRLDPSCSTDDETPTNDLEVRWDYDNDGEWDTDFGSLGVDNEYTPDPTTTEWIARLQVRDLDGNVATTTNTLQLGPFPTSPDMIAGSICISPENDWDTCVDTIGAGQSFAIMAYSTCFGDFSTVSSRGVIMLNGEVFYESTGWCSGGLFGCGGSGTSGFSIEAPGEYELILYVDYDNAYEETDESNNVVAMTLTVTP